MWCIRFLIMVFWVQPLVGMTSLADHSDSYSNAVLSTYADFPELFSVREVNKEDHLSVARVRVALGVPLVSMGALSLSQAGVDEQVFSQMLVIAGVFQLVMGVKSFFFSSAPDQRAQWVIGPHLESVKGVFSWSIGYSSQSHFFL